ncbi:MAG: hypothetical protein ACI8P0_000389 [Planctomycetaceae bacterium]|jgi:hypothetical protein
MIRRLTTSILILLVSGAGTLSSPSHSSAGDESDTDRQNTITAIAFLAEVDCVAFPESQDVLADNIENHEFEDVRYAAAKALFKQLQRGRRPLNPLYGWREIPDPFILEQVIRLSTFREPWTSEELTEMYADRKVEKERSQASKNGRKDLLKGCVSDNTIKVLARVAYSKDEFDCWVEPSERVRKEAENGLLVAFGVDQAEQRLAEILAKPEPMDPMAPMPDPTDPPPQTLADTSTLDSFRAGRGRRRGSLGAQGGFLGRADTANRFNLIDGIGASPRNRAWVAFQFLSAQNNATQISADTNRFISEFSGPVPTINGFTDLNSVQAQLDFKQVTGFGTGGVTGFPEVDVFEETFPGSGVVNIEGNRKKLRDQFLGQDDGRTEDFLRLGDTNLYRFGFEYALTPDFSVGLQAQYLTPLDDAVQQPATFSNPLILLKHVAYRDEKQVLAGLFGVSPQIPQDQISIVERTSRVSPGLLYYREIDDRWFAQAGTAFSLPTKRDQIFTWDWALGLGHWLYRHESLVDPDVIAPDNQFLLGIIPQFEVLGKHVIGDTTVRGAFGLSGLVPGTASGTVSSRTDSTELVFADGITRLSNAAFEFEEPRHVVDITTGVSFILPRNLTYSLGLSVPVTGGNARGLEFLTSLTYGF